MKKELYIEYQQELEGGKVRDIRKLIEPAEENCPTHFFAAAQRETTLRWLEKRELFKYIEELEARIEQLETLTEPLTDQDIFGGLG